MRAVICTICKQREAFFFRPYSGESLCRRCFIKSIEEKVRATIAKYKMLEYDNRIAVAVSGGKDSLSLLHILAKIEQKYPKASLVAVSVDEGIRGYRDKAIKMAAENCEIPEKETALYAYVRKIRFQSMSCPYASEAMRNDIRVFLNRMEQKYAGIKFTIFESIEKIRPRGSHPLHNHHRWRMQEVYIRLWSNIFRWRTDKQCSRLSPLHKHVS